MKPELSPAQRRKKARLERWGIILAALALLALTFLQRELVSLGPGFSESRGLVALVSINISVLLTTALLILILRNLYQIFFERQAKGSLQTKMVVSFISLSLLPTLLIFYYSYRVIVSGHDLWFSPQIESALAGSINLSEAALAMDNNFLTACGSDILDELEARRYSSTRRSALTLAEFQEFLESSRRRFHLSAVEFYGPQGQLIARAGAIDLPVVYHGWFAGQAGLPQPWINTAETETGDLTRLAWPLSFIETGNSTEFLGYLLVGRQTITPVRSRIEDLRQSLIGYRDALNVQRPFRVTQLAALTAMTMLAVFISIWIGSHLARSLARPVTELAEGTKRVAAGDWDYVINSPGGGNEFEALVKSFNRMTGDLKEMYGELERAQRLAAWQEVARRIAHEVKNPLTPIQLAAQRLQRRFRERLAAEEDAGVFEECTDVIIRQVDEMKQLVDEFSRFARLPETKPRPGDFAGFLEESLTLFRQAHKKVDFILDIKERPENFAFDPEQMRRALANILDNAVAAMKGEGEVRICLSPGDDQNSLRLSLADNGPGFDPKIKDKLFQPHITSKENGQGLGLAIVRSIISDHGGSIRAISPPSGGAAFVIRLPIKI